jgi:spore maturation protein CgeB
MDGELITPEYSLKLRNHSPDGFAWGYGGSGPSQLALAILLKVTTEENALCFYQDFKWEFIVNWIQQDCEVKIDIQRWLKKKLNGR